MAQFDFENLIATINESSVAKQNRFEAEVFFPSAVNVQSRNLSLRVKSLTMPGRTITTLTNETIYGPTHELAQGLTYDDVINITFFLSSDLREKKDFDSWQEFIYDTGTYGLNFYDEYVSNINIYQLDMQDNRTYGIELRETFPKVVSPLEYSQESVNAIHELTIGFAFREWREVNTGNPPSINPNTSTTIDNDTIVDAYGGNFRTAGDR